MRSKALIAVAVLVAALPAAASAAEPARVKLVKCTLKKQSAVFYGRMTRVPGTEWMQMRFTLQQRLAPGAVMPVQSKPLARWRVAEAGVRVFGYRQAVRGLVPDGVYRMVVDFRWFDDDDHVLHKTRRRSPVCGEQGPLANLRTRVVAARPTGVDGVHRYTVRIWNEGRTVASGFGIGFELDGAGVDQRTTYTLAPGESRQVSFRGPPCRSLVTAEVDPARVVPESDETDNVHQTTCDRLYD
jgi:CARDB protein